MMRSDDDRRRSSCPRAAGHRALMAARCRLGRHRPDCVAQPCGAKPPARKPSERRRDPPTGPATSPLDEAPLKDLDNELLDGSTTCPPGEPRPGEAAAGPARPLPAADAGSRPVRQPPPVRRPTQGDRATQDAAATKNP